MATVELCLAPKTTLFK